MWDSWNASRLCVTDVEDDRVTESAGIHSRGKHKIMSKSYETSKSVVSVVLVPHNFEVLLSI